jgi:hypothetical protein
VRFHRFTLTRAAKALLHLFPYRLEYDIEHRDQEDTD